MSVNRLIFGFFVFCFPLSLSLATSLDDYHKPDPTYDSITSDTVTFESVGVLRWEVVDGEKLPIIAVTTEESKRAFSQSGWLPALLSIAQEKSHRVCRYIAPDFQGSATVTHRDLHKVLLSESEGSAWLIDNEGHLKKVKIGHIPPEEGGWIFAYVFKRLVCVKKSSP